MTEEGEVVDTAISKSQGQASKSVPYAVATASSKRPAVLADGTYATQSATSEIALAAPTLALGSSGTSANLRALILTGDFFLGAVISCTLTKLVLKLKDLEESAVVVNKAVADALLIMVSILSLGQSSVLPQPIDNDSCDRITFCIRLLSNGPDLMRDVWLHTCRESFVKMITDKQHRETEETKAKAQITHAQPDDLIDFYHLKNRKVLLLNLTCGSYYALWFLLFHSCWHRNS